MRTLWPVVLAVLTAAAARSPPQGWSDPRSGELLQFHRNGAHLRPFDATMPSYIDMVVQRIKGNTTEVGKDPEMQKWCGSCYSMGSLAKLENVRALLSSTIAKNVPGDFAEAGTWRGGMGILARAVQWSAGEARHRRVYVSDSFGQGLPSNTTERDDNRWVRMSIGVSLNEVTENFNDFGLLDDGVHFVRGYFRYSLPLLRTHLQRGGRQLAVLRGDGDMYESYLDTLYNLYDLLAIGGYFICDDCAAIVMARDAIKDFRQKHGIGENIQVASQPHLSRKEQPNAAAWFWQKQRQVEVDYKWYRAWNATRKREEL